MPEQKTYLGDGVYAFFDGFQIWLTTERLGEGEHRIALDRDTYEALVAFAAKAAPSTPAKVG